MNYFWSKYNLLFKSEKYGHLLYNSLSNSFSELDEQTHKEIVKIKKDPDKYDFTKNPGLLMQLIQLKSLLKPGEEEELLNKLRLIRNYNNYSDSSLGLTIAPTQECNFNCVYCYEEYRKPIKMDDATEEALIDFIKRFGRLNYLSIVWYGGEPMMAFDRILSINKKIKELEVPYYSTMISNSYLFNKENVSRLKELKLRSIQVTIDGPEKIHNQRRPLVNGKGTYRKIISNIKLLLEKWNGTIQIRVNVDNNNKEYYHQIHEKLTEKFKKYIKRISIYPGIVEDLTGNVNPDISCPADRNEVVDFYVEQNEKYNISDLSYYPDTKYSSCVATSRNGFVVGPTGDLYKCWRDIGVDNMKIGNIKENTLDSTILSKYMIGVDPFNDPICSKCFYLPTCSGGCPSQRFMEKYSDVKADHCSKFKGNLKAFLEMHYEKKLKSQKKD